MHCTPVIESHGYDVISVVMVLLQAELRAVNTICRLTSLHE